MEQQKDPGQALLKLAEETANRSKIGRLRGVYSEIEIAQKAGVSNSKIVETLNDCGFELTLKTFETMLYRIRKGQQKANKPKQPDLTPEKASTNVDTSETKAGEPEADLSGLTKKQQRELKADKHMDTGPQNPLLRRLLDQDKNKDN